MPIHESIPSWTLKRQQTHRLACGILVIYSTYRHMWISCLILIIEPLLGNRPLFLPYGRTDKTGRSNPAHSTLWRFPRWPFPDSSAAAQQVEHMLLASALHQPHDQSIFDFRITFHQFAPGKQRKSI